MTSEQFLIALVAVLVIAVAIVLGVRRRPEPGLRDLVAIVDSLSKRVRELETEGAIDRGFIRQLEDKVYRLMRVIGRLGEGVKILHEQLVHLGEVPQWELPREAEEWLHQSRQRPPDPTIALYQKIGELFSEEELRDLVFRLGLEYEDLAGNTRRAKAQALVEKMGRMRRFSDLLKMVTELRPEVFGE